MSPLFAETSMVERDRLAADLFVDPAVSAAQEKQLVDALSAFHIAVSPRMVGARRGAEQLQWLVLMALPLQAFLSGVGGKIAEDAYGELKRTLQNLLNRDKRPKASRPIVLQDAATGLRVVLTPDLPEEAYQQLFHLKLSRFRLGPLHYDRYQRRWRSELDEADGIEVDGIEADGIGTGDG